MPRLVRLAAVACLSVAPLGCSQETPPLASAAPAAQKRAKKEPSAEPRRYVELRRTPDGGIQPQALVHQGVLHLIYFKGDPKSGDVYYARSKDDGKTFSKPLRVNSAPGSAIAMGNIRGAHLAVSEAGRAHVAWMGAHGAKPAAPGGGSPMLYARLNDAGDAFEPQRNLITQAEGLDGGGSLAAESKNVYVFWHAPTPGKRGEEHRRVWLAVSADDGATFDKERPISAEETGVCGCCGMRAFVSYPAYAGALYRSAQEGVHRDMYLLYFSQQKNRFESTKLQGWETGTCPMSSAAFAPMPNEDVIGWETDGQVWFASVAHGTGQVGKPIAAPGAAKKRKHPALASDGREVLFAWTEGMGWNRGGKLAWQVYDSKLNPIDEPRFLSSGQADGVPTWSLITAVPLGNSRFAIFY